MQSKNDSNTLLVNLTVSSYLSFREHFGDIENGTLSSIWKLVEEHSTDALLGIIACYSYWPLLVKMGKHYI